MSLISDIDFSKQGRQIGYFSVPCPRNDSAWGVIPIPIGFFKKGTGPRILLTGGAHGDEFEGPIALRKLMKKMEQVDFCGEIIIVPVMNVPAMNVSQRLSPLDGRDLNRSFSKDLSGITPSITHFVMDELISRADIVLDFHSGGNSLDFLPAIIMHEVSNREIYNKTWAGLEAFNAPYGLILEEIDAKGMLDSYVESLEKIFLTTELRGGGRLDLEGLRIAENGLARLLKHFGAIDSLDPFENVICEYRPSYFNVPDENSFVRSLSRGVFEAFVDLADDVKKGDIVGQIHDIQSCSIAPIMLEAKRSGKVLANRPRALCGPGDSLLMVGEQVGS